ncbi:rRNA methyltransferase [Rubrivivax sp. A210]|uniref:TrmH family RNA methyltransferase n=1 Tax=Rubrivivax sp. A210 TaxID=2772301 RepID=UPI001918D799|nr:RNA methyltransferase [Rubrivivax sp. A210]CAD5367270.1 rRNA methyltransferase [Rubrivivax sp. A210]
MSTVEPTRISSRDNPLLMRLRRLAQDGGAYRRVGQVWIEGEHLCAALRTRGGPALQAVVSEAAWEQPGLRELAGWAERVALLPPALFAGISGLESPTGIGYVIELPPPPALDPHAASVVLDRVQDAGNVGSILRSAAAFGAGQVLALKGTAALWSPKVLRAGMGAHFGLRLIEGLEEAALTALQVKLVATSSHGGAELPRAELPRPCAWVLGHEGQGVSATLLASCALQLRIPQPGGEESLNVAAAAAVCLYESARR